MLLFNILIVLSCSVKWRELKRKPFSQKERTRNILKFYPRQKSFPTLFSNRKIIFFRPGYFYLDHLINILILPEN